jgi:hypothetical protein
MSLLFMTWTKRAALLLRRRAPEVLIVSCVLAGLTLLFESPQLPRPAPAQSDPQLSRASPRPAAQLPVSPANEELHVERVVASMYREADSQRWELAQVVAAHRGAAATHSAERVGLTGKGTYLAVKQALGNVLFQNPDLALDRLAIARRSEEPGRVDVEADWSIQGESLLSSQSVILPTALAAPKAVDADATTAIRANVLVPPAAASSGMAIAVSAPPSTHANMIASISASVPAPPTPSGTLTIAVSGPQSVKLGGDFDVVLRANASAPLRALPATISYDPTHIQFQEFVPGEFVVGNRDTTVSQSVDAPAGRIILSVVHGGAGAISGEGVLGTIRFIAIAPGEAETSLLAATPIGAVQAVAAPTLPPPVHIHIQ